MPITSEGVRYSKEARTIKRRVFFSGNGALFQGVGLCYDRARSAASGPQFPATTATVYDETRDNVVALPATANRGDFAGVTSTSYTAVTGGQWIEIFEPGSVCPIATDIATTINVTQLTCMVNADPGVFGLKGNPGRGTAIALQTTLTATTTSGNGPNVSSVDGSATFTLATRNVAKTGLFANAVAGDLLVVYGGAVAADGTAPLTPQVATILTVTDANNGILAVGTTLGTAAAVTSICCQVVRANGQRPLVLARLLDGEESGCVDFLTILSAGAPALDINGYTYFAMGGLTIASSPVPTLAAQTITGRLRGFEMLGGVITTSDIAITATGILTDTTGVVKNSFAVGTSTKLGIAMRWSAQRWTPAAVMGGAFS